MPTNDDLNNMTPDELRAALKEAKMAEVLAKRQLEEARGDVRALAQGEGLERRVRSWNRPGRSGMG